MAMDEIKKVVNQIIEALEKDQWSRADRLQLVLNQLVKVEVAAIEGKKDL